jgi:hypothetical protein
MRDLCSSHTKGHTYAISGHVAKRSEMAELIEHHQKDIGCPAKLVPD